GMLFLSMVMVIGRVRTHCPFDRHSVVTAGNRSLASSSSPSRFVAFPGVDWRLRYLLPCLPLRSNRCSQWAEREREMTAFCQWTTHYPAVSSSSLIGYQTLYTGQINFIISN